LIDQPAKLPSLPSAEQAWVDAILDLENPNWRMFQALANTVKHTTNDAAHEQPAVLLKVALRKVELAALDIGELQALHASLEAKQARALEAKRFYRQPAAQANFPYWLAMDFWTLDEAIALLLGKNPEIVNPATIAKDLEQPNGFFARVANPPTDFTKFFKAAHLKAQHAKAMTTAKHLTPVEVARWGQSFLGKHLPNPLAELLANAPPEAATVTVAVPVTETASEAPVILRPVTVTAGTAQHPDATIRTLVNKAALLAQVAIWRTVDNDLHHAQRNGLAAAAKAEGRNQWWQEAAIDWAVRNGKIVPKNPTAPTSNLPGAFFDRM
jgi:hypothetical protein